MINRNNGELVFDNFVLRPHMKLDSLINKISKEDIISYTKGEWENIYLRPQMGEGYFFVIRLYFESKKLELAFLQIAVQKDDSIPSWENWSEKTQLDIKKNNDIWLKNELGNAPYDFRWGNIKSIYNAREGSSYVAINYN